MVSIEAKITGEGYNGIPSFKVSLWLENQSDETLILGRLYYELFTVPAREFLGSGEALVKGDGDNPITIMYLFSNGEKYGMASTFVLDERKIGIIDKTRAGEDAVFRIDVYGDARTRQIDKEGREKFAYRRLQDTCEVAVPKEKWRKWVDSWIDAQRILLIKKETFDMLNEALQKHKRADYDEVIQDLIVAEKARFQGITTPSKNKITAISKKKAAKQQSMAPTITSQAGN